MYKSTQLCRKKYESTVITFLSSFTPMHFLLFTKSTVDFWPMGVRPVGPISVCQARTRYRPSGFKEIQLQTTIDMFIPERRPDLS